ncbi:hypothetical protein INS49_000703 [Diaporthe citri]|uniref:uncharacterized protein n=1 Tax=Diaporthe citri TaxID=83186 RepID=UPI001C80FC8F|nr:uncharacterized protein INS49_000703 [Diaporthe citri]KAG6366526.1 hypothetical protein INS49_000703 [Diaporthe citri]
MARGDFEIITVPDQDTPTTAEISNPSDTEITSKPQDSTTFENAASSPSPTRARHHDQPFSKMRANFGDGPSSELSSPFTGFDTTHSRSDPVPLHFTTQRVDKMGRPPSLGSAGIMAGETMESYHSGYTSETEDGRADYILEAGMRSPGSRFHDFWADRPVGYVPAYWPTGPRKLPSGHYTCPHEGCEHPVGQTESGDGYSRTTLGPHIVSHGLYDVREAVRDRVRAMRHVQGRNMDDVVNPYEYYSHIPGHLQRVTDELILDLEELKNWEQSDRFVRPFVALPMTNGNSFHRSPRDEKHDPHEAAEEADDESVPHQNPNRFRNNRFRQARGASSGMRREEEDRSPSFAEYFKPFVEQFPDPPSPQEMEADTDSSFGPPRKRARKLRRQPDGSFHDYVPKGGEDPMELD